MYMPILSPPASQGSMPSSALQHELHTLLSESITQSVYPASACPVYGSFCQLASMIPTYRCSQKPMVDFTLGVPCMLVKYQATGLHDLVFATADTSAGLGHPV